MTTDIVSRKPAVSHCPTAAETCRSVISTGNATLMIVSFRMTTNADTSRTTITVRERGSNRSEVPPGVPGSPAGEAGLRTSPRSVTGHLQVGDGRSATIGRGHPTRLRKGTDRISSFPVRLRAAGRRRAVPAVPRRTRCSNSPRRVAFVDHAQVPVDRRARPRDVAGREEVEQAPPQHREQQRPVDVVRLRAHLVEKAEPVADGPGGEA